jgi:SPP1 family predicted phage head-tail adaptor
MNPGLLNRRITIQRRVTTQDAAGQPAQTWQTVADPWADVRTPTGLGSIKADAPTSTVRLSIRLRWRTDITADMRVLLSEQPYTITAVLPDHAGRQHIDLVCEATT